MSYTALYRKFRPHTFLDVKGQDHIVTTLKNQIKSERVGHAYLFCGTRGTGKTTIAKILAKAVNCLQPVDGDPCNECEMCKKISQGLSLNVVEIDAASNNGVDNIREIIDEVRYSPTEGKYKVYIIDEVHMLSTGAFNALLKTLEEPPHYVIFILATTESHKIPITILSRCQRYDFKRISIDTIAQRLQELMEIEHTMVEERAIRYIARAGDGSMRDALSLLDQCIAFYFGQELTYDHVLEVLGAVDVETYTRLLNDILNQNVTGCIQILDELTIAGRDLVQLTVDFTWYLRNLLLVKTTEDAKDLIEVSTENLKVLEELADRIETTVIMRYIRIFSELSNQIKYATQKRVMIEVALIKLCKPVMERNYDSLVNRLNQLEQRIAKGIVIQRNEDQIGYEKKETMQEIQEEPVVLPDAVPEEIKQIAQNWNAILTKVGGKLKLAEMVLRSATPALGSGNQLVLLFREAVDKGCIDKEDTMEEITNIISQYVGKQIQIITRLQEDGKDIPSDTIDLSKYASKVEIVYED